MNDKIKITTLMDTAMKTFLYCLIMLFFIFISPLTYSGECSGWFSSEPQLSTYMKKVMSEGIPIPLKSKDLESVATFKNLIIYWERDGAGGTVSGERPNFASLKKAKGHAEVVFQLTSELKNIPKIKKYIDSYQCNLANVSVNVSAKAENNHGETFDLKSISALSEVKKMQSEIQSLILDNYTCVLESAKLKNVTAEALLIANNKIIDRKTFKLKEGTNKIAFCDFAKLKQDVSEVEIIVKDHSVSFSSKFVKK